MHSFSRLFLACVMCLCLALPASAEPASTKTIMVLDASGSMWKQIDGTSKVEIAREVIAGLAGDWVASNHLGLIAYGHRVKGDCADIEQLIPVAEIDPEAFVKTVNSLNAKGKTPLTAAVRQAAEVLKYEEEAATVILLTDGLETCEADPCAMARELEQAGIQFTAHVVAFDVAEADQASLSCIAEETGGQFLAAADADQLQTALQAVAEEAATPPSGVQLQAIMKVGGEPILEDSLYWYIYDAAGKEVDGTNVNQPFIALEPGEYKVKVRHNTVHMTDTFTVPETGSLAHTVVVGTGHLKVSSVRLEGGETLSTGPVYKVYRRNEDGSAGEYVEFNNNATHTFPLGAGLYKVQSVLDDAAHAWADAVVVADETTELVINLNAGSLAVSSTLNGAPQDGTYWYVYALGEGAHGTGKNLDFNNNTSPTFALNAGDYILRASNYGLSINRYVPVSVSAGETTKTIVELAAE